MSALRATLERFARSDERVMLVFVVSMVLADGAILMLGGLIGGAR